MTGAPDVTNSTEAGPAAFVGRGAELREIGELIKGLGAGRAADCLVVVGPSGSGRTALLARTTGLALAAGWVTVPVDGPAAGPLGRRVTDAIGRASAELSRRRPGATSVRELVRVLDDASDGPRPSLRKLALMAGEAADESRCGVLLTVDDLPFGADAVSALDAVAAASRRALPALIVASASVGFDPDGTLSQLALPPLDSEALGELLRLRGLSGDARRLAEVTGGWPGYAVELAATDPVEWPADFAAMLARRVSGLRPAERRYLETVVELGPGPVEVTHVARALGDSTRFSPESSTLAAVRQSLVDAGFLTLPTPTTVLVALAGADEALHRR